jgi:AraC-like DNA-binding protein
MVCAPPRCSPPPCRIPAFKRTRTMDPRIRITLKLIREHNAASPFDLSEVCKMMGLSEPYLRRLFHREVGTTLGSRLREARMSRAATLLKQGFQPIKAVALDCGYNDISNFYRDFKSVHAVTPRDLRFKELTALADSQFPPSSSIPGNHRGSPLTARIR